MCWPFRSTSNTRPHYLERLGPEHGVFVRVSSTNRKAEALQIEELKRWNRMYSFDEQAIPELKSEAIDFRAASESFAPYRQMTSQAWSTLRIATEHQGRQVPTNRRTAAFRQGQVRPVSGCLDAGGSLLRNKSVPSARLSGDPLLLASSRGRSDSIRTQALDARIDHRGRPLGGSLVGSSGCDPGGADERHRPCGLRPARSAHQSCSI